MDNILLTGAEGFFGQHLLKLLIDKGKRVFSLKHSSDPSIGGDLLNSEHVQGIMFNAYHWGAKHVVHLAGYNGGIKFNEEYPFDIFSRNTTMALNVIKWAAAYKMEKVLSVVASCAYPVFRAEHCGRETGEILNECVFLRGEPHTTVSCHGYAKRNLFLASRYAQEQYGLNAVCICPTTIYGPGDSFEPERTKVMGGMIARFVKAKQENSSEVVCWGSGKAMREFIYVKDAAKYAYLSLLNYNDTSLPLNIGSGQEITIAELAEKVAKAVKYNGKIKWDATKPDGQLRKRLDRGRQIIILGDIPLTPLDEGIQLTVDWYENEIRNTAG